MQVAPVMRINVGILGNGNVGSALARGLLRAGHEVTAVGNDSQKICDTAAWAGVLILAVPFIAIDEVLANARLLEPLAYLNIQLGYMLKMGPEIGFKLLHGAPAAPEHPNDWRNP